MRHYGGVTPEHRIDWDQDVDDIGDGADDRLEYRGEPYTGEIVQQGVDGLLAQEFYVNGIAHGPIREWWADGTPRSEGQVREGLEYGDFREWYKNGQLASVKHFDDHGMLVKLEEWDDDGNQTRFE